MNRKVCYGVLQEFRGLILQGTGSGFRHIPGFIQRDVQVLLLLRAASEIIQANVTGYSIKPSCKGGSRPILLNLEKRTHKCFLSQFLGITVVSRHSPNEARHLRMVPLHQQVERRSVTSLQGGDIRPIRILVDDFRHAESVLAGVFGETLDSQLEQSLVLRRIQDFPQLKDMLQRRFLKLAHRCVNLGDGLLDL